MGKNHMKRMSAARSWPVKRKITKYITKPMPGAHSFNSGMSLNVVLKELLKLANTSREVKEILKSGVYVDGNKVVAERYLVGSMDIITFTGKSEAYRILLNSNGFLTAVKIGNDESKIKLS